MNETREPGDDSPIQETTKNKEVTKPEPQAEVALATEKTLPSAAVAASLTNNWSGVAIKDRMRFVGALCQSLNIPLPLCPFRFIKMRDKEVLYAPNEAAALIGNQNRVSVTELKREYDKETQILTIWMRASQPDGRNVDNCAAVFLGGKVGEDRANAIMKTHTKALRRCVLAAVGLTVATDDDLTAMRDIQQQTLVEPEPVKPAPVPETPDEREAKEARLELFRKLCGKAGRFPSNPDAATTWIREQTGKGYGELNASEAEQLMADLEVDEDQPELPGAA